MTGRSYSTAVPSTLACMKKAPSPHTETQGRSGAANFAPITPATPKPIGPNPIEPISESGRFGLQKPSSQLWCTPMSLTRIASSGSALSISSARSEEHTSELQSRSDLVCRLLLEKKKTKKNNTDTDDSKPAPLRWHNHIKRSF